MHKIFSFPLKISIKFSIHIDTLKLSQSNSKNLFFIFPFLLGSLRFPTPFISQISLLVVTRLFIIFPSLLNCLFALLKKLCKNDQISSCPVNLCFFFLSCIDFFLILLYHFYLLLIFYFSVLHSYYKQLLKRNNTIKASCIIIKIVVCQSSFTFFKHSNFGKKIANQSHSFCLPLG